jgi:glycosyltransferase involved in cell wall biosynthesis
VPTDVVAEPVEAGAPSTPPSEPRPGSPRTVCHLMASNFVGGPEKQILEHCRHLDPSRWRGVIGSFRENRDAVALTEAARERGVAGFLIDTRSPFSPSAVVQLRRELHRNRVDVLVTHGYKADVVGRLASGVTGIPAVPYHRGYTAETWKVRRYETVDRAVLARSRRVLCVSEAGSRRLAALGVPEERIRTVHNAVALPETIPGADLHAEFDIPAGAPVIAAAGRLSAEKGHRFLVEALPRIADPAAHLVLFGEGREEPALRIQVRALDVSDRVRFAGFRPGVLPYLAAADVVVNPSLTEGLPNVVLEALSVGAPVVATDVGGVAEIVRPGETGWLVPAADPLALAAGVTEALADRAGARRRGETGRRLVARSFSFEGQAALLMGIYDDVAGE